MRAALLIAGKDLRLQVRNRSVLVLGFVAPLSLAFVLNLVFGGTDDPDAPVTFDVALADLDGGEEATRFVEVIEGIAGSGLFQLERFTDEAATRAAVDDGTVSAAWVVPDGFTDDVRSGGGAEVLVIADVDATTTAAVARAVAERYATDLATATLAARAAVEAGVAAPDRAGEVAAEVAAGEPLARLAAVDAEEDLLSPTTSLTAGLALFFVFFAAGLPLLSVLEERSAGTLARLLAAPVPSGAITAGKAMAAVVLGVVSLVALMVASGFLMGADWGPPVAALLLVVAAVVAATGILSVAGFLARTTEQAGNLQGIVAVVLGILGGVFVPIPATSGPLAQARLVTPHAWFIDGLQDASRAGTAAALPAVGVMLVMGIVTGAVGMRLSRSVLRR